MADEGVFKSIRTAWAGMGFKDVSLNLLANGKNKLIHICPSFMPNPFVLEYFTNSVPHHTNLGYSNKFK